MKRKRTISVDTPIGSVSENVEKEEKSNVEK